MPNTMSQEDDNMDWAILPLTKPKIDRVKASEKLSVNLEKIITSNDDPVTVLDNFLCRLTYFAKRFPEDPKTIRGSIAMSMEVILMRAVWYLWHRCPDMAKKHIRQSLGMVPMAFSKDTKESVIHASRISPEWWPDFQRLLFKDIHDCLVNCTRKHIDATFGYRMIYLTCFMTDRISPMNIGNYCLEEAKLLEILITAIGILRQKTQVDDHYLSEVVRRALQGNRPINYCQAMANAAFFLNSMARLMIKEKIFIAIRNQSDNKPLGLHAKKVAMLNLSKLLFEYMPYAPTMKEILQKILSLCPRLELAYKLLHSQKYVEASYDCLPTCLDLAFPTVVDDPKDFRYVCEFSYLRDVLRFIERKHPTLSQELLGSLEPEQVKKFDYYRNYYEPGNRLSLPDANLCKFQCVNHRFLADESNVCPLLNRECVIKKAKEFSTPPS